MSQQSQQQAQQAQGQPTTSQQGLDLQQVLIALQQAGLNQDTINFVANLGTQQQNMQNQITTLNNGLASVQHVLTAQQQTISAYQQQQQHSSTHIKSDIKIEKPSKFDGSAKKFKNWLFQFEQYCEITGLDQQSVEQAQYALTLFEKAASTWWQVTLKTKPVTLAISTLQWSFLKHEMEQQFVDSDRERKLLASFQDFKQLNDLNSYIQNFQKLTLELGKLVTDQSILWQFIRGLKPNLRKEVLKDSNLNTVSDAILIAERIAAADAFADNFDNFKKKNIKYKQNILGDFSDPMEIDTMFNNAKRDTGATTRGNGRTTRGKGPVTRGGRASVATRDTQCFYCGKYGHFAKNCYEKQRDQSRSNLHHMHTMPNHHTPVQTCACNQPTCNNVSGVHPLPPPPPKN